MAIDLRRQFLNFMTVERFSDHTKRLYLRSMIGLVKYYNQSPDTLTNEQIQEYFRHLIEDRKLAWGTCNNYFSAVICFYKNVCKWDETNFHIPPRPRAKKLPIILNTEEVKRLFAAAANLKHQVLLKTVYSAGLRVGEVVRLKPHHLESDPSRMMIRVEQGKGRKDRYTVLSQHLLIDLRAYWRKYNPGKWLFAGQKRENHLTEAAAQRAYYHAKKKPA
jgi:site-specific recombinase XerD